VLSAGLVAAANYYEFLPKRQGGVEATASPKLEIEQIVEKLQDVVELPEREEPSLATVTDPTKLSDQVFFKQAEVGDKVLLYAAAGRAVLYRPKTGRVIEMGPFILTNPSSNPLLAATPPSGVGK
jgi:hypothetical protein